MRMTHDSGLDGRVPSHCYRIVLALSTLLITAAASIGAAGAADLRVMKTGLGAGTVNGAGISCGGDCDTTSSTPIILTAIPDPGSTFSGWDGNCSGTASTCSVPMTTNSSVRARFDLSPAIAPLGGFTPADIEAYLAANPQVNSPARFIAALSMEFKQNWLLMSRSESLQTGTAQSPRILLPSADARFVFTVGMTTSSSYPGSHPLAIEYMQWDAGTKSFRFHEIVLDNIPAIGVLPARSRGVSRDDAKCFACHSTRNVPSLDRSVVPHIPGSIPGTDGVPPGTVPSKSKPNWDAYDSWGGMLPFNRDRIYQGSVEAAAFRKMFNLWTWRTNMPVRSVIEQLELQPPGVPAAHVITRINGGANDGHINFAFDASPPVLTEPVPMGPSSSSIAYEFNGAPGSSGTSVTRGGLFVTLHHSGTPTSDEGRGVQLFDLLGGADGTLNQQRIADELITHRFATGSVPIDVRPIALAITKFCVAVDAPANTVRGMSPLSIDLSFFTARNGMSINDLVSDTATRKQSLPRRKADNQKLNFHRDGDPYLLAATNGLIQEHGAATSAGTDVSLARLRQEVFRRPIDAGAPDATVMGGVYVDREVYLNELIALYRYFLEPLGVSVDKWSMGVRGRSRTYTFADVFGTYTSTLQTELEASLTSNPVPGLSAPFACPALITAVNNTLSSLPPTNAVPTYTDVQRIFNKSCIECHGGLAYPPYPSTFLDLSENESPASGETRLTRSHEKVVSTYTTTDPTTSYLFQRITQTGEACPGGLMPCGGPSLSKADIETIRRWIVGPTSRPGTVGDPHIRTIEGINYDFQSAGEFVLLRGEGLEIQARQSAVETELPLGPNPYTGLSSCVSVNTAVAVRIGPHRITYQPNLSGQPDPDSLDLRLGGERVQLGSQGIALRSGGRIIRTTAAGGVQIEAPGGTAIVITPGWWDYYRMWYLNIDVSHPRATEGLMGAIAPRNWLPALPNGTFLGPKPTDLHQRYVDLYQKFADAWRVPNSSSLFDYAPGTSTETFTDLTWPRENPQSCAFPSDPEGPPRKPPVKPVKLEVAEQHCRDIVAEDRRANCVQDVMITGEAGFARTYVMAEKIARNRPPTVPRLVSPEDEAASLPRSVGFIWKKSTDPDGDPVTYRFCLWGVDNGFQGSDCTPVTSHLMATRTDNILRAGLEGLGLLLFVGLLIPGMTKRNKFISLVVVSMLTAVMVSGCSLLDMTTRIDTVGKTVSGLESNKAYFWKVIAQDDKGGSTESETWRFTTQ